jgi:hypothetical protein
MMEVNNNTRANSSILSNDEQKNLGGFTNQNQNKQVEDQNSFKDAAKIDIVDLSLKKAEGRELSNESAAYISANNIDLAQDSANFSKQSVLAHAGSIMAAQSHANPAATRAVLG